MRNLTQRGQTLILRAWERLLREQRGSMGRSLAVFLAILTVSAVVIALGWDTIMEFCRMILEPIGPDGMIMSKVLAP